MTTDNSSPVMGEYSEKQIASMSPQQRTEYARHLLSVGHTMETVEKRFGGLSPTDKRNAEAQKTSLMKDKAWVKKYMDGDVEALAKMESLNKIIVGSKG